MIWGSGKGGSRVWNALGDGGAMVERDGWTGVKLIRPYVAFL